MALVIRRFDVYLINLDPTIGSEIQKTRPCVVVSPDEMNRPLATAIVAPMTTQGKAYPSRFPCRFDGRDGHVVLDQLRTVDKARIVRRLGSLASDERDAVLAAIAEMFAA